MFSIRTSCDMRHKLLRSQCSLVSPDLLQCKPSRGKGIRQSDRLARICGRVRGDVWERASWPQTVCLYASLPLYLSACLFVCLSLPRCGSEEEKQTNTRPAAAIYATASSPATPREQPTILTLTNYFPSMVTRNSRVAEG